MTRCSTYQRVKRVLEVVVVVVVTVAALLVTAGSHNAQGSPAVVSHSIRATASDEATLKATFLASKFNHHEMTATDPVRWTKVLHSGSVGPSMTYDGVDHRYWAFVARYLVTRASYRAELSFHDGGSAKIKKRQVAVNG